MSNQREQMDKTNKPKIMTGFIHYNDSVDLSSLFKTLGAFRQNYGLKYSHQGSVRLVFFNISSEHLGELAKVTPFKISRFQTKTEYQCDKETADKLMSQKDSFVRMLWDENTNILTFMSRTTSKVHGNLVRRIFKDSDVNLNREFYKVIREETTDGGDDKDDENVDDENVDEQQVKQVQQTQQTQPIMSCPNEEVCEVPEGFQRVTNKRNKKTEMVKETESVATGNLNQNYKFTGTKSRSKVVKETDGEINTKPKARGRTPKATV